MAQRLHADEGYGGEEQDRNEQQQGSPGGLEAVEAQYQEATCQTEYDIDGKINAWDLFPEEEIKAPTQHQGSDPKNIGTFHMCILLRTVPEYNP